MNSKGMWALVIALLVVIIALGYVLVVTPAPRTTTTSTSDTAMGTNLGTETGTGQSGVTITAPKSGATVPGTFSVTGSAPGSWYFEAVFPVQVRDPAGNVVGRGQAHALTDWMTTGQVAFKADITVASYKGAATLILMKDNPSGLPQNDDAVTIPITIK